jgi:hypothetical protein
MNSLQQPHEVRLRGLSDLEKRTVWCTPEHSDGATASIEPSLDDTIDMPVPPFLSCENAGLTRSLEAAMRRGYLLLLPAVLGLAGFVRAPAASTPLTVNGIYCNVSGGWWYDCYADVSGGSGVYNSFAWTITERSAAYFVSQKSAWTYVSEYSDMCNDDNNYTVELTVTDSQWATATGMTMFYCD